jgi:hypothetical protein
MIVKASDNHLGAARAEQWRAAAERERCCRWTGLGQLARGLPGLAEVSAPVLVAGMGKRRFPLRRALRVLRRAGADGQRDRRHRPQGPADEQGRQEPAARHVGGRGAKRITAEH